MSIHKPPTIKYPVKVQKGNSKKIVYRTIRDIQQLKNNQAVGIARIKNKSQMVRKQGIYWVVV
ncbi:hypothetical protein A6770_18760 [Nostoc minutum NIES-26]|uniref:Uncharacterized protein n=1 Tax=Nostoc minutum NIES-26 TaxID=1844469 RepID=A0A367R7N8_9NOSO|nr:hypothetical protein A6770_18760 [Nostoc minutum NIES-26]